jgi:hypothetical protein
VREAAGERLPALELSVQVPFVAVTQDRHAAATAIHQQLEAMFGTGFGLSVDDVLASPATLLGTIDEMVEELQARRERYGFLYIVAWEAALEQFAPVVARLAGR